MRVLLDEDVAMQALKPLRHILTGHHVDHVKDIGWSTKTDRSIFADAKRKGYRVLVTKNTGQLKDPDECRALRKSRLHHVTYTQDPGLDGLGRALGAMFAAMPGILKELEGVRGQTLLRIRAVKGARHDKIDTKTVAYWGR